MTTPHTFAFMAALGFSGTVAAADFSFDRPGAGFGTSTVPVGQLVWEQSLANAQYSEFRDEQGQKVKQTQLNADVLLRTGLSDGLELQLGWQGPSWSKTKVAGQSYNEDGLGDVSVALKKNIDLNDDHLSMAVLAQAVLATGNDTFTEHDDIYTLGTTVAYQYEDGIDTSISMFYSVQDGYWRVTAVPTLEYQFSERLGGFSELVYSKKESQDNEYHLGTGLVYQVNSRLQFDTSVGVGLNGQTDQYQMGIGFAYAF